jgi:pimeloyl-ACP methyl ester carboxylesterase
MSESEYEITLERPKYAQSVYSASSYGQEIHMSPSVFSFAHPPADSAMAIAQYLRSPRLTRLMTLRKHPQRGLKVSIADVGNPNGRPVLVFLGLGCVRYLIALYDEMAEALGLRLIAIDRWGMGRTDEVPQESRGLKEWAAVCEEVIDTLGIKDVGVLAHSAGAPYALAFALRMNHRITGSIHLLAPWVGGGIDAGESFFFVTFRDYEADTFQSWL